MKRLLAFLVVQYARYRWRSVAILLLMMTSLTYEMTFSLSFRFLIDHILIPRKLGLAGLFLLVLGLGATVSAVSSLGKDHLLARVGVRMQQQLRLRVFAHLQTLPASYYEQRSSSSIQTRVGTDVNQVHTSFLSFPSVVYALLGLMGSAFFLTSLNWRFAVLTFVGVTLSFLLPLMLSGPATRANDLLKSQESRYGELVNERTTNHDIIRAYGLRAWELSRMESTATELVPVSIRAQFFGNLMHQSVSITLMLLNLIIIAVGTFMVINGEGSIGMLVAFQSFYVMVTRYVARMTEYLPQFNKTAVCLQRLDEIFAASPTEVRSSAHLTAFRLHNSIHLKNVSFGYRPGRKLMKNVTMDLTAPSYCAVVGTNGSGKTTLAKLLLRFYDPDEGGIEFDGVDSRQIPADTVRQSIGYVPQAPTLFNMNFRENIRLGWPGATDEQVEEAARAAGIHDWIVSLPQGYAAEVGEFGQQLSGGQRQRVAIARALIRQGNVIVLDEATSSLDPGSEQTVYETIRGLATEKLVVSITHRLQAVTQAHQIFVMEDGELVNVGTHDELLEKSEVYQSIWHKQSGFTITADGITASISPSRLKIIPLFQNFTEEALADMCTGMTTQTRDAGALVTEQGEVGDYFYIIVRGEVEVLHRRESEEVVRLAVLEDGDYFGEMALLRDIPRTATVRTLQPCTFLVMQRDVFQRVLQQASHLREELEAVYATRFAEQQVES